MAKNFDGITGEPMAIVTNKVACAVKPYLRLPDLNHFAQVIDQKASYIQMSLNDYNQNVYVKFNIDLSDFDYLTSCAKNCFMARDYSAQKIWAKYPEQSGQFQGFCKAFHIQIRRQEKTQSGQIQRNPWLISIQNGYAKAAAVGKNGAMVEASGTFRATGSVQTYMADKDFQKLCSQVELYSKMFLNMPFVQEAFAKGYMAWLDTENQRDSSRQYTRNPNYQQPYNQSYNQPVYQQMPAQNPTTQPAPSQMPVQNQPVRPAQPAQPAQPVQPVQMQTAPPQTVQSAPPQSQPPYQPPAGQANVQPAPANTAHPTAKAYPMKVIGEFTTYVDSNIAEAMCLIQGAQYNVLFDCVPQEVDEAIRTQKEIDGLFYMKDGHIHFCGIAKKTA